MPSYPIDVPDVSTFDWQVGDRVETTYTETGRVHIDTITRVNTPPLNMRDRMTAYKCYGQGHQNIMVVTDKPGTSVRLMSRQNPVPDIPGWHRVGDVTWMDIRTLTHKYDRLSRHDRELVSDLVLRLSQKRD